MAELIGNCPRCGSKKITFQAKAEIITHQQYGWQNWHEAFCVCRNCSCGTIFILSDKNPALQGVHTEGILGLENSLNNYLNIEGYISIKDENTVKPPEHIPKTVEQIFREGATCMAVGCCNAAGTMFRLCIDLVTRPLLPKEETEGLSSKMRRDLGLRLPWLFANKLLPDSLKDLSTCIKEDGNDGAHAGTLEAKDAEDLLDFTSTLLERLFTEPERLRLAQERRDARRNMK